jgi:uncharacterized protein (TIGR02466 family)
VLSHVFTTPILRAATGLTAENLAEVRDYLMALRKSAPGGKVSNIGGWHSEGNLFAPEHGRIDFLREAVTRAVFGYIGEAFGYSGQLQLAITGWAVINCAGDFNAPHTHAANLLSGALYIAVPEEMRGGHIVFYDPRCGLNAFKTDAMRRMNLKPPWHQTMISVAPAPGEVLVFPSWLLHYVEPFQSDAPEAARIVVSFNASPV